MRWLLVGAVVVGLAGCGEREEESVEVGLEEMGYTATVEDFHRAAEIGDVGAMARLLDKGVEFDGVTPDGDTALHAAAAAGSGPAIVFLLEEGLEVDARGAEERTPLMAAAAANRPEVVRQLLRAGAKPELVDGKGYRALTLAADGGRTESIEVLAVYSREFLDDALLLASLRGHSKATGMLADLGASVYARMDDGMTPLMLAAREGHEDTVKVLLDRGANRYAVDGEDLTAGQLASEAGHGPVAEILNRAPGAEEFALPPLPELAGGEADDGQVSGALLGAVVGAVVGGGQDAQPVVGAVIGGGEGYVVGGNEEAQDPQPVVGGGQDAQPVVGAVIGEGGADGTIEGEMAEPAGEAAPNDGATIGAVVGAVVGGTDEDKGIGAVVGNRDPGAVDPDRGAEPAEVPGGLEPEPPLAGREGGETAPESEPIGDEPAVTGLVMEHYEEKTLPLRVEAVEGKEARVRYLYGENERVTVKEGEEIPLTGLRVVKVEHRRDHSKSSKGEWMDVSIVVLEDPATGERRELVANLGASAQDPFAVLRGGAGPVVVRRGSLVTSSTGTRFKVLDVRPSQVVLEEAAGGAVHTLPLQKGR